MKGRKRYWALAATVVLLGILAVLAAVAWQKIAGHQVGLAIVDPPTGKSHFIGSEGFREVVLEIDDEASTFRTLRWMEGGFDTRVMDFSGKVLSTRRLPLQCDLYPGMNYYCFSPDGNRFFYFRHRDQALCMLEGDAETVVMPAVASTALSIPLVRWIAENELLLILKADEKVGRARDVILRLNVQTKDTRTLYEPTDIDRFDHAVSPDGKLLAFADGGRRHDIFRDLKVVDLQTGQLMCQYENKIQRILAQPTWNGGGTRILFSIGGEITNIDLQGQRGETLVRIPQSHICYHLLWIDDVTVIYVEGTADTSTLNRLDLRTGQHAQLNDPGINGSMHRLNNGRVLCEVGY